MELLNCLRRFETEVAVVWTCENHIERRVLSAEGTRASGRPRGGGVETVKEDLRERGM